MLENQVLDDRRQLSYLVEDFPISVRSNPLEETLNINELFVFLDTIYLHNIGYRFEWPSHLKHKDFATLNGDFFVTCQYRTRASEVRRKRLPDYDVRLKLSKLVGLDGLPKPDSNALEKLSGMIEDKIINETIDSVELIREIRGS